ncbi:MAG: 7TM domain-containing protein [Pseudomonadota bacterium]
MTNDFIEEMVFVYPELLLIVLAVVIMLGRYNGYKLTEYRRFRKLAETAG